MDVLKKICSYCIYQERSNKEVWDKLETWGVRSVEAEELVAWLVNENFINENRYARQFVGGKFRVKKWGRKKIIFELKARGISSDVIQEALSEIEEEEYKNTLLDLARRKKEVISEQGSFLYVQKKTIDYLIGKGYEVDYIREVLRLL